jgi:hypothetical protein
MTGEKISSPKRLPQVDNTDLMAIAFALIAH